MEAMVEIPTSRRDPADEIEEQETKSLVLAAVDALPEHQRQATTLFYISGFSQKQIADFLEVPVTTVDNRLRASRKLLKATLQSERMLTMLKDTLGENAPSRDDSFVNAISICNAAQAGRSATGSRRFLLLSRSWQPKILLQITNTSRSIWRRKKVMPKLCGCY